MEIRTKFDVGDKVWIIDCFENFEHNAEWFVHYEMEIDGIKIEIEDDEITIFYCFVDTGEPEELCFATKEEAQKECDRRNANKI